MRSTVLVRCKVSACRSTERFPAGSAAPIQTRFTLCPGRRAAARLHTSRSLRANPASYARCRTAGRVPALRYDRPAVRMADEDDSAVQGVEDGANPGCTAVQVSEESPVEPVSGQSRQPWQGHLRRPSPASTTPVPGGVVRARRWPLRTYGSTLARKPQEEVGHQSGPPGLVRGADIAAPITVEVLVEREKVVPLGSWPESALRRRPALSVPPSYAPSALGRTRPHARRGLRLRRRRASRAVSASGVMRVGLCWAGALRARLE